MRSDENKMEPTNAPVITMRSPLTLALLGTVAVLIALLCMKQASDLLAPLLLDIVLAILFTPALRWLERKGLPTPLALLVLTLVLVAFLLFMILILLLSLSQLQVRLPIYEGLLLQRLSSVEMLLASKGIEIQGGLTADTLSDTAILKTTIGTITGVLTNVVGLVFYLFLLFLMLAASKDIARKVQRSEGRGRFFSAQFAVYAHQIQQQYRIQTLSNFLSALAIMIELFLFRIDFALLWGFLAFVLGFIPNIGLIIATLPAIVLALILHGWHTALAIILITIALNAAMDNLVTPRFMGTGLNLPMLPIFLSFLIWSWVFGFLGALLAVPATLFLRALFQSHKETQVLAVFLVKEAPGEASGQSQGKKAE